MIRERELAEEKEDLDDFMRSIHDYLEQPAATEKEDSFKNEILGYLSLIEERPRESFKLPELKVGKISKDLFSHRGKPETKDKEKAVGKLDTSALFHSGDDFKKPAAAAVSVSGDACKNARAVLEDKISSSNRDIGALKNYNKRKIVGVREATSEEAGSKVASKTTREWKWKSKKPEVAALQQFVESSGRHMGAGGIVNRKRNEATMELEKKSEELAKNLEAKEREFQGGFERHDSKLTSSS